jgi:prepilin peptidase CpaA
LSDLMTDAASWLSSSQGNLAFPLLLTLWIAWGDLKTHRIPNYLTLAAALSGLSYQLAFHGWSGLGAGCLGLVLGFAFLIVPYMLGGMGAGDVKALAALGTWLGPWLTFLLFCYMGIAGGLFALGVLWWKGLLRAWLQRGWVWLLNWILNRPYGAAPGASTPPLTTQGIPYGAAMAAGMVVLFWKVVGAPS